MQRLIALSALGACVGVCVGLAAFAAPPPKGALPDALAPPCDPPLAPPQSLVAAIRSQFTEEQPRPLPPLPAADVAAYTKMQADQQKRDWPNICNFRADNLALSQKPADPQRVVFMGDSITQNWLLAHDDFFVTHFVNRGISGQTTPQMLVRFRADVIALHPAAVHIMAGINDIAGNTGPSTLSAIEDNIADMVEIATANNVRVILGSTLPADKFNWAPKIHPADDVRALDAWMKDYAARNHLTYVDYYTPMATASGGLKPELTLDGVHPNKKGYDVMEPSTRAAVAAALKR